MTLKSSVQPIRDWDKIDALYEYFLNHGQYRNWLMVRLGLNLALRISDLLKLQVCTVYNSNMSPVSKFTIREKKTGKENRLTLNVSAMQTLAEYANYTALPYSAEYLFKSRQGGGPISRVQAYRIINAAARKVGIDEEIGTHTLRKTWGYHAYTRFGMSLDDIMLKLNHSSLRATKHYIGLSDDEKVAIENSVFF